MPVEPVKTDELRLGQPAALVRRPQRRLHAARDRGRRLRAGRRGHDLRRAPGADDDDPRGRRRRTPRRCGCPRLSRGIHLVTAVFEGDGLRRLARPGRRSCWCSDVAHQRHDRWRASFPAEARAVVPTRRTVSGVRHRRHVQ